MYARLSDKVMLRGWRGLPYAVVDKTSGNTLFLDEKLFSYLGHCDGYHNIDVQYLKEKHPWIWARVREYRAFDVSDKPFPPGLPTPLSGYKKFPCRAVTGALWSITGGCNLRCRHCYISAPHYKYHDLDTADCLRIVDQLAAAGVVSVALTGGEPLMRKDFWTIVDALRANDIVIDMILTNALLADDLFLDEFEKRGLDCPFQVSFDGVGCHDWLRGIPGSEEKTIASLRRLIKRGRRVVVTTSLHAGNIDSLFPTYEFLVELGVSSWRSGNTNLTGEWVATSSAPDAPKPLPREELWSRYFDLAKRYIADGKPISIQLGLCYHSAKGEASKAGVTAVREEMEWRLNTYSCRICRTHPSIMPDGRLLPCTGMVGQELEVEMPNLLETPLVEVYSDMNRPFFDLANLTIRDILDANERCRDCKWRMECGGGCRLNAIMNGQGSRGYSPDMCAFFRDGWREKFGALA